MDDREYTNRFDDLNRRRRSRRRVDFLLRAYSWMGVSLAIVAAGYFLLTLLSFELSMEQQLALMVAGVGVLLSLMSRILVALRKERDTEFDYAEERDRSSFFLKVWAEFERVGKKVLAQKEEELNVHSVRSVISRLYDEGRIDDEDVRVLERGLRTRNAIVHGGSKESIRVNERVTESVVEVMRKVAKAARHTPES